MTCNKCGTKNAPLKKCCSSCGAFLEGRAINNVTGEVGYRNADGSFTPDSAKNTEQQVQPDKSTKCVFPDNYIICGAYDGNGNCKSPKGTCAG